LQSKYPSMPKDNFINRGWGICAFFSAVILITIVMAGCRHDKVNELYHKFPDKTWGRFNLLRFEIPVTQVDKPYNVYLFARFTPAFVYEKLNFNMVMNSTDGEERINAYEMEVKTKSGAFNGKCIQDTCEATILLKRELHIGKPGILKIEIENLTPRLVTEGVGGIGIRMVPSGK